MINSMQSGMSNRIKLVFIKLFMFNQSMFTHSRKSRALITTLAFGGFVLFTVSK